MNTAYVIILLLCYILFTILSRKGKVIDKLIMITILTFPIYFVSKENGISFDQRFLLILLMGFTMSVIHKVLNLDKYLFLKK